jgi:hypothetical protein
LDELLYLMSEPAIQNLDFLRQLIAEARQDVPQEDMEKLRMLYGMGMGTEREEA